jgi:hypothetical protein
VTDTKTIKKSGLSSSSSRITPTKTEKMISQSQTWTGTENPQSTPIKSAAYMTVIEIYTSQKLYSTISSSRFNSVMPFTSVIRNYKTLKATLFNDVSQTLELKENNVSNSATNQKKLINSMILFSLFAYIICVN